MPLLQSEKIYNFSIPFSVDNPKDLSILRQEFITKYNSVTEITDPDYSTLLSFYSSYEQKTYYYLNLPYINDPINTTKGKLFISLCFPTENIDNNGLFIIGTRGLNGVGGISYNDPKRYDTRIKLNNNAMVKYKNSSEFINYENNFKFGSNNVSGFNYFCIDARYLESNKFYIINSLYCETENELSKIYFSPTTIVCDMEDQITGQHYDAVLALQTNGCMWDLYDQSEYGTENYNMLAGLGINFDSDNEPQYVNSSFFPQIWSMTTQIRLHRLRFGRLKSNNIFLTYIPEYYKIHDLVNYKKMPEYQNEWLTDKIHNDNQKFMFGVSALDNIGDYAERSQVKNQFILVTNEKKINSYTPEQIIEFASRDMVIGARIGYARFSKEEKNKVGTYNNFSRFVLGGENGRALLDAGIVMSNMYTRHHNDGKRKIGLIRGVLSDGSFCVSILGTGKLLRQGSTSSPRPASRCNDFFIMGASINCSFNACYQDSGGNYRNYSSPIRYDPDKQVYIRSKEGFLPCEPYWGGSSFDTYVSYQFRRSAFFSTDNYQNGAIRKADALDFSPTWVPWGTSNILYDYLAPNYFINMFATLNGNTFPNDAGGNIQFTTDKDTTLTIGNLEEQWDYTDLNSYFCANDGKHYLCGNLYDDLRIEANKIISYFDGQSMSVPELVDSDDHYIQTDLADILHGTYAAYNKLYNIPFTHNEDEALRYIDDGTIPSDVIIYPFDVEDINSNFTED